MDDIFCPTCGNCLVYLISSDLMIVCSNCGYQDVADPNQTLVSGGYSDVYDTIDNNKRQIKNAAHDITNPKVEKECNKCGRKIVTMIRVTKKEITVYICICGHTWY